MARRIISLGQRYRDREVWWLEWEVLRVYQGPLKVSHAVLANVACPTETKTIACSILLDRRRYRPSPQGAGRDLGAAPGAEAIAPA
ncbi:MAG: hypothetical protein ACE5KF_09750 [Kiloniellaceae bacterium]